MKLVELLAMELDEWPDDAGDCVQDADRDGTIWFLPSRRGELDFNSGSWLCKGSNFDIMISRPSELSSDYDTAIVTRKMWKAERDRQKGGERKRHRGGYQKLDDEVLVEVKLRNGDIFQAMSEDLVWAHHNCPACDNIMQYRIISQPQAEEVEMVSAKTIEAMDATDRGEGRTFNSAQDLYAALDITSKAKTDQIDGPIKWRDTIIHCQAIIEDCEREIKRNVDLLDAEGLMMQTDSKKAMQHYVSDVDMSDWRNWKAGDVLKMLDDDWCDTSQGSEYEICSVHENGFNFIDDISDLRKVRIDGETVTADGHIDGFKFIRRP